jgi:hypothetical protein
MSDRAASRRESYLPKLASLHLPAKASVSAVILTMAIAIMGAFGQIIVHDSIPTFFAEEEMGGHSRHKMGFLSLPEVGEAVGEHGDLFSTAPLKEEFAPPFYKKEQFLWTLKWTHIHLFGMNMIFIFMGAITLLLDLSARTRTWLIVLPFIGVLIDIAAVWLKGYISPTFFWLHIPGGGLFAVIFILVSLRAFWEMWRVGSVG